MIGRIILAVIFGTIGTGIGFGVGAGYRSVSTLITQTAAGMCNTVDTAANQGLITPAQALEIGKSVVKQTPKEQANNISKVFGTDVSKAGEACKQFQQGLKQA
ncbi:hypothetical protein ACQ4M3_39385 [Leptolyngbya sp. AN03gr2]|uniref:hypothetical protein n=1 Tax=unclassified Leptolyngbya TaxID=2650499 RepID=UPI003D312162